MIQTISYLDRQVAHSERHSSLPKSNSRPNVLDLLLWPSAYHIFNRFKMMYVLDEIFKVQSFKSVIFEIQHFAVYLNSTFIPRYYDVAQQCRRRMHTFGCSIGKCWYKRIWIREFVFWILKWYHFSKSRSLIAHEKVSGHKQGVSFTWHAINTNYQLYKNG